MNEVRIRNRISTVTNGSGALQRGSTGHSDPLRIDARAVVSLEWNQVARVIITEMASCWSSGASVLLGSSSWVAVGLEAPAKATFAALFGLRAGGAAGVAGVDLTTAYRYNQNMMEYYTCKPIIMYVF